MERKVEGDSLETQTSPVLKIKGHNFEIKLLDSSNPG